MAARGSVAGPTGWLLTMRSIAAALESLEEDKDFRDFVEKAEDGAESRGSVKKELRKKIGKRFKELTSSFHTLEHEVRAVDDDREAAETAMLAKDEEITRLRARLRDFARKEEEMERLEDSLRGIAGLLAQAAEAAGQPPAQAPSARRVPANNN
jgi:hypothetical protein